MRHLQTQRHKLCPSKFNNHDSIIAKIESNHTKSHINSSDVSLTLLWLWLQNLFLLCPSLLFGQFLLISTLVLLGRIISCTWQLSHCLFASVENLPSALLGISFLASCCCVAPVADVVISCCLTKSAANCVQIVLVNGMEGSRCSCALMAINHVMSLCLSPPLPKKIVFIQQRSCSSSYSSRWSRLYSAKRRSCNNNKQASTMSRLDMFDGAACVAAANSAA